LKEVSYFEPNRPEIISVFLGICEIMPQLVGTFVVNSGRRFEAFHPEPNFFSENRNPMEIREHKRENGGGSVSQNGGNFAKSSVPL
jgi:hypothetical protein